MCDYVSTVVSNGPAPEGAIGTVLAAVNKRETILLFARAFKVDSFRETLAVGDE